LKNLTLIIPAKHEADSLPIFLDELKGFDCQIIIVLSKEDVDTENAIIIKDNIKIVHQKKEGYGYALIEGFNASTTEYSCIINADGSMDPKYLDEMLKECKYRDFIFASRYERPGGGSDDDTIVTLIGNKIFSLMGNILYNLNISDILYTYILGKTESFKNLNLISNDFRLCVELPIKAKKKGLTYRCLASYERSRIAGKKKVNAIKDGFLILIEILSFILKK
tara:strand:+ start:449 stop:1117 length:669 start_codon:yes stop_codon:yes gene_type:complete